MALNIVSYSMVSQCLRLIETTFDATGRTVILCTFSTFSSFTDTGVATLN